MNNIFEKRALNRRHRAGDLNTAITLLSPPLKTSIGVGVCLAIGAAVWACFAEIPILVRGTGILIPSGTIEQLVSRVNGRTNLLPKQTKTWQGLALRLLDEPGSLSNKQILELSENILSSYRVQEKIEAVSTNQSKLHSNYENRLYPKGTLLLWSRSIDARDALTVELEKQKALDKALSAQISMLKDKQQSLEVELRTHKKFFAAMKQLEEKGYIKKIKILQERAKIDNIQSNIYSNKEKLNDSRKQLENSYAKLSSLLSKTISNGMRFAKYDAYIYKISFNDGEVIHKGNPILIVSNKKLIGPSYVPVFLSNKDSAKVFKGMKTLTTPTAYNKAEVGGIKGEVISVSPLSSSFQDLKMRIGDDALAKAITGLHPNPSIAIIKLAREPGDQDDNRGGYLWTSKGKLPFPPKVGNLLNIQIETRRVHPISLVIPKLRALTGLTAADMPEANMESRKNGKLSGNGNQ